MHDMHVTLMRSTDLERKGYVVVQLGAAHAPALEAFELQHEEGGDAHEADALGCRPLFFAFGAEPRGGGWGRGGMGRGVTNRTK